MSDLFLINWVLLFIATSARVSDMIHTLDRYVGFIPLGLFASAADSD